MQGDAKGFKVGFFTDLYGVVFADFGSDWEIDDNVVYRSFAEELNDKWKLKENKHVPANVSIAQPLD